MPKFLVTYHGAGAPAPEEAQQAMAAFMAWASSAGAALADPGAPLGPARTVSSGSVTDGAADGPLTGYSILQAADLDSAMDLVKDHPFVSRGRVSAGQHGDAARLTFIGLAACRTGNTESGCYRRRRRPRVTRSGPGPDRHPGSGWPSLPR